MALKNSMKRAIVVVGVLVLISMTAVAQEIRSEISVQGTGFFTKDTQGNGVLDRATETGGFLVGYRYNFNRWLAAEATMAMTAIHRCTSGTHSRAYSRTSISSPAQPW
jgi:predicted exporter